MRRMNNIPTAQQLSDYFTHERTAAFWARNRHAYGRSVGSTRTPFTLVFVEDWIKWKMSVADHARYYTDLRFQRDLRTRCGEHTARVVGLPLNPAVNLGSTIFASLFGGEILYTKHSSPWIRPVIAEPSDVRSLLELTRADDLLDRGQIKSWLDGYQLLADIDPGAELPFFGSYFHGLATLGCMLVGAAEFIFLLTDHPEEGHLLMQIIGDVAIRFMDAMREFTGDSATGLILANDDLGLLSPGLYEEFCLSPELGLFDHYSNSSFDMRGYHSDSHCDHHFSTLRELRLTDINIAPNVSVRELRRCFPDSVIHGQIPPLTFRDASVREVIESTIGILEDAGDDPDLVMSIVGCLNEGTPLENILSIMWAIESRKGGDLIETPSDGQVPDGTRRLTKGMPMILEVE